MIGVKCNIEISTLYSRVVRRKAIGREVVVASFFVMEVGKAVVCGWLGVAEPRDSIFCREL
jgi:hypothetical protein